MVGAHSHNCQADGQCFGAGVGLLEEGFRLFHRGGMAPVDPSVIVGVVDQAQSICEWRI